MIYGSFQDWFEAVVSDRLAYTVRVDDKVIAKCGHRVVGRWFTKTSKGWTK